jgi:hypothetical protein
MLLWLQITPKKLETNKQQQQQQEEKWFLEPPFAVKNLFFRPRMNKRNISDKIPRPTKWSDQEESCPTCLYFTTTMRARARTRKIDS